MIIVILCVLCCTSRAASAIGGIGSCWSLLFEQASTKFILKIYQSLTNLLPNVTTSSKNNKLVIPTCPAHTGHMTENGRGHGRPPHRGPYEESLHSHVRARHTEQGPWPYTVDRNI